MEGLASSFEVITQGIKGLADLLKYINPFDENFILKGIIETIGNILSYINPFSENFFGWKLIELFGNLLQKLFIPSEESVNNLVDSVKSKFAFIDYIKSSVNDINSILNGSVPAPSLTIHVSDSSFTTAQDIKVLDLTWYKQFKEFGDKIITGFIYALFIWRIYIGLPNIISGAGSTINDVPAEVSDIQAYAKFGFGRATTTKRGKGNLRN